MPNIRDAFDPGALAIRPTETGVEATAATARRVGMFFNQRAGAVDTLARETDRLASATARQGAETQQLGRDTQRLGAETGQLGDFEGRLMTDVGRRAGSAIEYAGDQAVKYLDHQQISHGALTFTQLLAGKTAEWNNTVKNADPNDPTVGARFMQNSVEPSLEKFQQEGFYTENGQKWAEAHVDALRKHFAEKTAADMSTLAGHAANINMRQTINTLSNTVRSDPSSLDFSMAALESGTEGVLSSSPNLTGAEAARVRSEITQQGKEAIVKSAAFGYIEKTGQVPPWATDPKYSPYVSGVELKQLATAAKVQQRTFSLQDKQDFLLRKYLADYAVHTGANKVITDNVAPDPTNPGRMIMKPDFFNQALDLAKKNPDSAIAATTVKTLIDWGEHQQNQRAQPVVSDPQVKADLLTRMFDPNSPTSQIDILRAEADGKLATHDGTTMRGLQKAVQDAGLHSEGFKETLSAAKGVITYTTPGMPGKDPHGMENYARFVQDFVPKYQAAVRAGTLPPNALDFKDPNSLISKTMEQYKRTPKQRMDDWTEEIRSIPGGNISDSNITGVERVNAPPVPPAPQREINKVYELPKGRFKWNGSGWEKP